MESRILVVEDSPTQAMALCGVLEEHGLVVIRMPSAEDALDYLAEHAVDLVLTDIVMPGMSGYDLCRRIRHDTRLADLPIVLLTSLADPLDIVRGLECGADNYVTKPYDPEYLYARLRHVLDRQRLRRSPKASLGVSVSFLGTNFSITSDKEQILDLFISSVEEVVRTNGALQESQRELVTAQARLEEYARAMARQAELSAEKYATLMRQAGDAILVLDQEGHIVEANERAAELLGRALEEIHGRRLDAFTSDEGRDRLRAAFARSGGAARTTVPAVGFVHPDGHVVWCDFSASRTTIAGGDLVLVILHDVTSLRQTTERLRRREAQLAQAQQIASLGSFERDFRTGGGAWSAEMYRLLGEDPGRPSLTFDEVVRRTHPTDRPLLTDAVATMRARGEPMDLELRMTRADGALRVMLVRGEPESEHGAIVRMVGTMQDVTERRQLEQQLLHAQKMEAVGQLAGGVAHDFNNLLTVITSYSAMMLAELPADAAQRGDLQEIRAAADRAAALTRQLLAFSRSQVLQPQLVDLNALTRDIQRMLRRLVREDIDIETRFDPALGLVEADPGQLEQVLVNLVVNARDAMPQGGTLTIATANVNVDVATTRGDGERGLPVGRYAVLTVRDTGAGIPTDVLERIFEPFFTTKPPGEGTGLGLSTVYGIVRQSGGHVLVDSAPGEGTCFGIYLPLVDANPSGAVGRGAGATTVPAPPTTGETILVVEDDAALRAVAARVLRKHGYVVLQARDGREALEICGRHEGPLDLVLTDMVMPELGGDELARRIASRFPDVRTLVMSGYTRDAVARRELGRDGMHFLEKPFTPDRLVARVRDVLEGRMTATGEHPRPDHPRPEHPRPERPRAGTPPDVAAAGTDEETGAPR